MGPVPDEKELAFFSQHGGSRWQAEPLSKCPSPCPAVGEMVNALKDLIFTGHQAEVSGFHWAQGATGLFLSVESNKSQPIWVRYGTQAAVAGDLRELEPTLL